MGRLNGKVAIVTGGARGLGAGTVEALCAEGAAVVIADMLDDSGKELAAKLGREGHRVHYTHLDVREPAEWASLVDETMTRWGRIDCLVNNAGISIIVDIESATIEQFRKVLDVNVLGAFLGMQAIIPAMRKGGGGSIVNIASNSTHMIMPLTSIYGASKAAIANLTKSAAAHCALRGDNIRVNSVHPGSHATEMSDSPEVREMPLTRELLRAIPMGRMGMPSELGKVVAFLASDDSSYMTGSEVFSDGGLTMVSFADPARA
jgi:3alpha(or 20beta)-hydroxysteroid dehydrogenase